MNFLALKFLRHLFFFKYAIGRVRKRGFGNTNAAVGCRYNIYCTNSKPQKLSFTQKIKGISMLSYTKSLHPMMAEGDGLSMCRIVKRYFSVYLDYNIDLNIRLRFQGYYIGRDWSH